MEYFADGVEVTLSEYIQAVLESLNEQHDESISLRGEPKYNNDKVIFDHLWREEKRIENAISILRHHLRKLSPTGKALKVLIMSGTNPSKRKEDLKQMLGI